jgi:mRNA interferase MazF
VKRGEIWTVAGGPDYAGKARPAVIVQADIFSDTASVTVCLITSEASQTPLFRLVVEPSETNGLRARSWLMVDKLTTLAKSKAGYRVGQLSNEDIARLNSALIVFLGIAAPLRQNRS